MKQEASTKKRGPDILVYLIAFLQLQLREDRILIQSHYRTKVHLVQFLNQANYWLKTEKPKATLLYCRSLADDVQHLFPSEK